PTGDTIRSPLMADGSQTVTSVLWVAPPHYYKAGRLIALYVGSDNDVIDALQDAMGPRFAGGAGARRCPAIRFRQLRPSFLTVVRSTTT
ncbi:MAG: hypothetical protein J4N67_11045, partial [Chloroflexi bacterium]|nr:hypothetical protein [Chloroflexota bacterium]